jgi:hypothetical protein
VRIRTLPALFVLGVVVAPIGDHMHVVSGTERYDHHAYAVPYLWQVPITFPLMVAVATVALAVVRRWVGPSRHDVTARHALAGVAVVMGTYAVSALGIPHPAVSTTLVWAIALAGTAVLADGYAVAIGILTAVIGTAVEIVLTHAGLFAYSPANDQLAGVGGWLPALYLIFGVTVATLTEWLDDAGDRVR